jgi:glycosyltransferase involved in cell wall biosynthesis
MLIGVDFRSAAGPRAGIGTYIFHLVKNLSKVDTLNSYVLYCRTPCLDLVDQDGRFRIKTFKGPLFFWHIRVLFDILCGKIDLYFTSSFILSSVLRKGSCILFIPDATGYMFPEYHTLKVGILTKLYRIAVRKAKRVLTISQASRRDIIDHFHISSDKIIVTYLAASPDFKEIHDKSFLDSVRVRHGLPDKYILFVGSIEPRKNLVGLINAFDKIRAKIDHKLVIVGGSGWRNSDVYETIENTHLGKSILFTGYVTHDDLVAIYNLAEAFVFPSFYEGFGIPPLEAMACGVPVITSSAASLPEVVSDAAIQVDPYDTGALADAIYRIIHDRALRDELIRKGFSRVKQFSWHLTAEETLRALSQASREID